MFYDVKLIKNTDISKYRYPVYGIEFHWRGAFLHPSGGFDNNPVVFGVDMSSSVHVDHFLILGESPTQGLDDKILKY